MARTASHSHWPTSHPYNATRRHFVPKAECDRGWTEYLHWHTGARCILQDEPGYKKPRCQLIGRDKPDTRAEALKEAQDRWRAFAESELVRAIVGGPPV